MTDKLELIKRLLLQGERLEDIRTQAKTSWRMIYKVIEENGMQEFRQEVTRRYKSKNAHRLRTPSVTQKRNTTLKQLDRKLLGHQVKNQKRLDDKVLELGYKNCSEYISQHGVISFRNNILAN